MDDNQNTPPQSRHKRWDIFCQVIDNFGDAAVCWRLARQLANEYDISVRLWIDDVATLACLDSKLNANTEIQHIDNIEVRCWLDPFPPISATPVVIEAFGCQLPEIYELAMVRRLIPPAWINLEYLSAEPWVDGVHLQASPHPRLPLVKFFFCPGFSSGSGGLLREQGLLSLRSVFQQNPRRIQEFWQQIGLHPPETNVVTLSLFCYDPPILEDWLDCCANGKQRIRCIVPTLPKLNSIPRLEAWLGIPALQQDTRYQRGALEVVAIPFLSYDDFDQLLWACDFNFVRGEDSFVRAQWAARPFIWNIYPQTDQAHHTKLQAFFDRYCESMPNDCNRLLQQMNCLWNGVAIPEKLSDVWNALLEQRAWLTQNTFAWSEYLGTQPDLVQRLLEFNQINNIG